MQKSEKDPTRKPETTHTSDPVEFGGLIVPPFYGCGEILTWSTNLLLDSVKNKELYARYWTTGKNGSSENRDEMEGKLAEIFRILTEEITENDLIDARGFYAYYPVIADKNSIILLSPDDFHSEVMSLYFPQSGDRSIAAFFRPEGDVLPILAATIGNRFVDGFNKYNQEEGVKEYYLPVPGNYLIDIVAEKMITEIQRGLGLPKNQGRKYHFGDSGMPGKEKNQDLIELLCADDRLGITVNESYQLQPEHSSIALFVHHPEVTK